MYGVIRKSCPTINCRVSFIDLYLVFPRNFRMIFLPHTNTVILLSQSLGYLWLDTNTLPDKAKTTANIELWNNIDKSNLNISLTSKKDTWTFNSRSEQLNKDWCGISTFHCVPWQDCDSTWELPPKEVGFDANSPRFFVIGSFLLIRISRGQHEKTIQCAYAPWAESRRDNKMSSTRETLHGLDLNERGVWKSRKPESGIRNPE